MTTPAPVAFERAGRYAVIVGFTTFITTVPTGVPSMVRSCCVHRWSRRDPGQTSTTWARMGVHAMSHAMAA